MIPVRYTIGSGLASIAVLRILDVAWPTEFLPWWVYAIEWAVGAAMMISGTRALTAR